MNESEAILSIFELLEGHLQIINIMGIVLIGLCVVVVFLARKIGKLEEQLKVEKK